MGFTAEQFMEWVDETFPDNNLRAIAESNFRDGLKVLAQYVFDTNSSTFIQESLEQVTTLRDQAETAVFDTEAKRLATEALYNLVLSDKTATQLIKDQAQTLLDNALTLTNPLGEWAADTNTPELTAVPPAGPNGSWRDITTDGTATFAGSNFAVGDALAAGGRLIKKDDTQYFYQKPTNLGLTKSIKLEKDTVVAELMTETPGATSANGGVSTASPPVITVPIGQTGSGSAITKTLQMANHTNFFPGAVLRFYVLYSVSEAGIQNSKLSIQLNVNRGAGTVTNQAGARTNVVDGLNIKTYFDYAVQAGDVWVQPFIQVVGSGIPNATAADWVFTLKSVYVEVTNPNSDVSRLTDQFRRMAERSDTNAAGILANVSAIAAKAVHNAVIPTAYNGQALAGATGNSTARVSIPAGQTGNSSYVRGLLPISEFPNWADMLGIPVTFTYKVLTSADFYPAKGLTSFLTVFRSGSDITGTITGNAITKLSPTVLQVSFTYIPNQGDTILKPYIQTSAAGAAVVADSFFEMQEFTYSHALPLGFKTENDYIFAKEKAWLTQKTRGVEARATTLEGQMATANTNIATNATNITARTVNNSLVPTSYSGQAVAGATGGGTKRVSIPTGQTGNGSYVRAVIPIAEIPNWADLIGIPVTISYRVYMSTDFYPAKNLISALTVFRSGSDVAGSITGNTVTLVSANVVQVKFTYTPTLNDTILKPYIQTSGAGAAVAADSFFEMQEITYSHAVPAGYTSESSYFLAKEKAWYAAKIQSLTDRLTTAEGLITTITRVTKTVRPDGTGDYLSPKLANDAITDSSVSKQYEIVIYPGVYTETEWKAKPYTHWRGIDQRTCWLKGELADNADNSHQTTSTLWLIKTATLSNLRITAKNMRYAVHSENSGLNPNELHNVFNCHVEHYGNQGLIDWRNANPGSGLNAADVWASARPWGYGAASGLVENYDNCTFAAGTREAYYVHSNKDFDKPNINNLRNCRLRRQGFGQAVVVESLGSGQPDILDMRGCSVTPGYIRQNDTPWISQLAVNQYANHANYGIFVSGTSILGYRDTTRGKALRIKSKSVLAGSKVRISGDAAPLILGTIFEADGGVGLAGYAYGYWDISGILVGLASDVAVSNTLGKRLGDCSVTNRTLSVAVDGAAAINVVFNADYTAASNASILALINAAISAVAIADEYNPALNEYYPDFEDRILSLINTGATGIPRFHAVGYNTDKSNVRLITTADAADKFVGVALENIPAGKSGRILVAGVMEKNIQIPGVTGVVGYDTEISLSSTVDGQFELTSAKVVMKGVATDWAQFEGKY